MQETLRRIQARRAAGDQGFTLIELLVVVVIIGVLVGISIPLYMNYTKGAANKSAQSDVRNAITAVEQYYTDNNAYPTTVSGGEPVNGKAQPLDLDGKGKATVSDGNTLKYKINGTDGYVLCAQNTTGGTFYRYDSKAGGSVDKFTGNGFDACLTPSS